MEDNFKKIIKRTIPFRELQFYYEKKTGEVLSDYISKDKIIEKIEELEEENAEIVKELTNLSIKYKFAGKGAVSWSIPEEAFTFSKKSITESIKGVHGAEIFKKEIKPNLSKNPELNRAEWVRKDLLKLEFAYIENSFLIEQNYEIMEVTPTKRLVVLIRIDSDSIIVESRANFQKSQRLHKKVGRILGVNMKILEFSIEEIKQLKKLLKARKKAARHKKSAGDFDIVEVTAAHTISDLDSGIEYIQFLSKDEMKYARYEFNHSSEDKSETKITFYISCRGSIWFMSEVPEGVINNVFSKVRNVKQI